MANITVHSTITRKNAIIMGVLVAFFLFLFAFDLYAWLGKGFFHPVELAFEVFVLYILAERMGAKYTYELGKRSIIFTKRGLFGRDAKHEVLYKDIFGIYLYKAKLVSYIKFRRTFRLNSALDGRDVWVLGYEYHDDKGAKQNHRVYFKPSPEMLAALKDKLPGKVHGTEEKTIQELVKEEIKAEQ
ncbi:MAG: hypothetical protein N2491_01040 [Negativicutes bacterium]|nr:hypothetical protein [Negativicutes bacterium]